MSSNYNDLSREHAIEKLKEVKLNPDLTVDQKIDEFGKIANSQIFDITGASFYLVLNDDIVYRSTNFNSSKHHQFSILYIPIDSTLPIVVLSYDKVN